MIKYYTLGCALKRSCIEIKPDPELKGELLDLFLDSIPSSEDRLPESIVFRIKACKKEYDIIGAYHCWTKNFYSKELMDVLNRFTDMSDRSYRINLPDAVEEYYVIYKLKEYQLINRPEINAGRTSIDDPEPPLRFVFGETDLGPVFSIATTAWIIISEEIMKALKKAKITNVEFREVYGYTPEEAQQWAEENPDLASDFLKRP